MYKYFFGILVSVILDVYWEMKLLYHIVMFFFFLVCVFLRNCHIFFHSSYSILHSTNRVQRFQFLHILPGYILFVFDSSYPDGCKLILHCSFDLHLSNVRTGRGTTDWFQIGKGVRQRCILSPCLFNLLCRVHHEKRWTGRNISWQSWFHLVFLPVQHFTWCTLCRS